MAAECNGAAQADAGRTTARLRCYANDFAAEFSLSEVELRFGQRFGGGEALSVHTWIVTSPVHLVTLSRVIAATIAAYEGRYGAIPCAGPDDRGRGAI
ncbi:MAG: hypothetical protein IT556_01890 [Acetobacteraceae bacterium]|nr:hypothetical protein [Acetobacteraceae bacterium]